VEGGKHVLRPEDLHILPGVLNAIADLTQAGWPVFVFTNQSGVGRGYMTEAALDAIHDYLHCEVVKAGGELTAIYACPHHPTAGCDCRKPQPGMLLQASREHNIDLGASVVVGDSPRDIAAGKAAGARAVLVLSGRTRDYSPERFPFPQPDEVFPDLMTFARWLLNQACNLVRPTLN